VRLGIDDHAAATVKLLKDLHEQNLIEGRAAGEYIWPSSVIYQADVF